MLQCGFQFKLCLLEMREPLERLERLQPSTNWDPGYRALLEVMTRISKNLRLINACIAITMYPFGSVSDLWTLAGLRQLQAMVSSNIGATRDQLSIVL
jgi:hypothetical protein